MAHVLIVDDDPINRELLAILLTHREHHVSEAADGAAALAMLRQQPADLVVTDILMPTMDGYEFVRRMRTLASCADTPVVFYTAHYNEHEALSLGRQCGVTRVITKPAEPEAVLRILDDVLQAPAPDISAPAARRFDREHHRLVGDKLVETTQELERESARLGALIELNLQLASEPDPQRLLEQLCRAARSLSASRYATVLIADGGDGLAKVCVSGFDETVAGTLADALAHERSIERLCLLDRPVRKANPTGDPVALGLPASHPPVHSILIVPIRSASRTYGWVCTTGKLGAASFSEAEERLLAALAGQVGRTYEISRLSDERARTVERLKREIAAREAAENRLRLQFEVARILADASNLDQAAPAVIEAICKTTGFSSGVIWQVDEGAGVMRCPAAWSPIPEARDGFIADARDATLAPGQGVAGRVWVTGRAEWISDVATDSQFLVSRAAAAAGLRSAVVYPLAVRGKVLGVIVHMASVPRAPEPDTMEMFAALGHQIGQWIERTRQEEAFLYVFRNNPLPMFVFDQVSLAIVEVNDAAVTVYGFSRDEFLGMPVVELRDPLERAAALKALNELKGKHDHRLLSRHRRKDGRLMDVDLFARTVTFKGRPARLILSQDITTQLQTEAQLREAHKLEAVGQLTGGLAHDLNNIITLILGNLDLLKYGDVTALDFDECYTGAYSAALRGADLTRSLLAFARRQPLQPRSVDINRLLADAERLLHPMLSERITLVIDLADDLWSIRVDPVQLEAAILNLAANARDAMPRGGTLTIRTRNRELDAPLGPAADPLAPGDYVSLEIADTGSGIAPEIISRIFEPFFTTKGRSAGTGLGLSMVFGFMKQSDGHIEARSTPGLGTRFELLFPRNHAPPDTKADHPSTELQGRGESVLVVEDNDRLREIVGRQLRRLGYRVLEAPGAAAALDILGAGTAIDLVFTDIVMPGTMDGMDLAEAVRGRWPQTSVVLTSGFPDVDGSHGDIAHASHRLLSKPYSRLDLARTLRTALDAAAVSTSRSAGV